MKLSSFNKFLNHIAWVVAFELAIYSASIDDRATVGCFLDDHTTAPPPNKKTYPDTDLQSINDEPQFASEKPETYMSACPFKSS
jgi:hypothetical protein